MLKAAKTWKTREFDQDNAINIFHQKPAGFGDDHMKWDTKPDKKMPNGMAQEPAFKKWQYQIVTEASACV